MHEPKPLKVPAVIMIFPENNLSSDNLTSFERHFEMLTFSAMKGSSATFDSRLAVDPISILSELPFVYCQIVPSLTDNLLPAKKQRTYVRTQVLSTYCVYVRLMYQTC